MSRRPRRNSSATARCSAAPLAAAWAAHYSENFAGELDQGRTVRMAHSLLSPRYIAKEIGVRPDEWLRIIRCSDKTAPRPKVLIGQLCRTSCAPAKIIQGCQ